MLTISQHIGQNPYSKITLHYITHKSVIFGLGSCIALVWFMDLELLDPDFVFLHFRVHLRWGVSTIKLLDYIAFELTWLQVPTSTIR